jgi:hypothetical protein
MEISPNLTAQSRKVTKGAKFVLDEKSMRGPSVFLLS